ncbi:Pentatricopeptide repeat-containing protein PFL1605w [Durusdinium trenchii]|uniref:Pentatricopeptide repeat-containing protein PFL1605w n=1 Tax=Durusdinium trenchii TaxID=1381693 RepID=A0ABP0PV89_9DINO
MWAVVRQAKAHFPPLTLLHETACRTCCEPVFESQRRSLVSSWRPIAEALHSARLVSTASFLPPPKSRWSPSNELPAKLGFVQSQRRTSRKKNLKAVHQSQKATSNQTSSPPRAARQALRPVKAGSPPVKKVRRNQKKHRHSTDLEDLGDAPNSLPHFDRQVKRLQQRPIAALPRTPQFFVRFGPPMTAEDLTHDAPSVFVESRKLLDDVLERREKLQSAPDFVAPDTPFWRVPAKLRKKKTPKWQAKAEGEEETSKVENPSEAAEQLKGIVNLGRPPGGRRAEPLSPAKASIKLLDEGESMPHDSEETVQSEAEQDSASSFSHASRPLRPEQSLIASLRQKAADFARTGANPDLVESMAEALRHHPGTERAARIREMRSCVMDFETLIQEGKASVSNCNELIRAQALQGRMEEAVQTHDSMKLHGYEPDSETFVSLLLGAAQHGDAELARRFFLKMREQLVSATPKVYAALIHAHVRAGDTASGYSLLRKMEDERVQPDVVVHTILINGLVHEGRLETAWEEFHSIRTWKLIQPDEVLFTVMIKACAMASEAERALNLLDDLRISGLYPTDITYGELIRAMSSSQDHAKKAFDFYRQMQAEDLPISSFVFEHLLRACAQLGDPKRAKTTIHEMREYGLVLSPVMYCHLVSLFASAMRRPHTSENEKLQNLRYAWNVVAEARRACESRINWTSMLNEVLRVYVAGGFAEFAVEMLPQYAEFGVNPDADTWAHLLRMFGDDLKDVGRFFLLWDTVPQDIKLSDDLYHLALEMALQSRSSQQTCAVLEQMYSVSVFPTPQLAERLAKAGRHVIQIHQQIGKFISLNRDLKIAAAKRETALLQTHMDEREAYLAADGLTVRSPTPEQEYRDRYFDQLHKQGVFKRPWLPFGEYLASKQKGGEAYAKRHDKPRPNLLSANGPS